MINSQKSAFSQAPKKRHFPLPKKKYEDLCTTYLAVPLDKDPPLAGVDPEPRKGTSEDLKVSVHKSKPTSDDDKIQKAAGTYFWGAKIAAVAIFIVCYGTTKLVLKGKKRKERSCLSPHKFCDLAGFPLKMIIS